MSEVFPLRDHDGRDWWKALDPYGGLRTRTRPARAAAAPARRAGGATSPPGWCASPSGAATSTGW